MPNKEILFHKLTFTCSVFHTHPLPPPPTLETLSYTPQASFEVLTQGRMLLLCLHFLSADIQYCFGNILLNVFQVNHLDILFFQTNFSGHLVAGESLAGWCFTSTLGSIPGFAHPALQTPAVLLLLLLLACSEHRAPAAGEKQCLHQVDEGMTGTAGGPAAVDGQPAEQRLSMA